MPPKKVRRTTELVFGDSTGTVIYDELIRILSAMTSTPWGYHRSGKSHKTKHRSIQYISVADLPLRVAVVKDNAVNAPAKRHWSTQWYINVTPGDILSPEYEDIVAHDLQTKLTAILGNTKIKLPKDNVLTPYTNNARETMLRSVLAYPRSYVAEEHAYMIEQQRVHATENITVYNKYIDRCLYDITVVIDS